MSKSRLGVLAIGSSLVVGISTVLRAALLVRHWGDVDPSIPRLAGIFGIGLLFDAVVCVYAALPAALALLVAPDRLVRARWFRPVVCVLWAAFVYVSFFGATAEWTFWDEFGSRFNFVAVDYLVYTKEVVGNIRESYPMELILPALLLPTAYVAWRTWRDVAAELDVPTTFRARLVPVAGIAAAAAIAIAAVPDDLGDFSGNRWADQLARNGVHSLVAAFRNNRLDYDDFYAVRPEAELVPRLRELVGAPADPAATDLTRHVTGTTDGRRPNVVIVCVESLSAWFLEEFQEEDTEPPGPTITPRLDVLSERSLFFTRMYSTGTRTVRGLEALSLSFPPTPGASVVKRPGNEGLFSAGFLFRDRGYDTRFIYGGYGYFDNMNAFFAGNGFDVIDRTDLADSEITFGNVWGVCDEDLFARTLTECDRSAAAGKPFFQFLMTTSNHRPYTYPDGRIAVPSGTSREGAVAYTDYAIGKFLDDAASHPWFENTVFVVVADHCSQARGKTELPVNRFHIPMWVYAPKLVPPRRCDDLCSQIDAMPTLLGLLGWSYDSRFLGVDVVRTPPGRALLGNYLHLGLYDGARLITLGPHRVVTMDAVTRGGMNVTRQTEPDPALALDAITWFQGAHHLLETGKQTRIR
ncbi:MAG: LTA synthase family protein [Planctomycetes bacterium]|nr:LTA synthase family protein [Planctomycetota bacterium]